MKWRFHTQIIFSVIIIIAFNILSTAFQHWIYRNIGFILCGLMYLIHPVAPEKITASKQMLSAIRIAGVVLILIGIFTRSYVY